MTMSNEASEDIAWWVGWTVPDDIPEEHMVEQWPDNMRGWCSGYGDDYQTYVGIVFAPDADSAMDVAAGCYGDSADRIGSRWEPTEIGDTVNDRFLGAADWLREQRVQRKSPTEEA